VGRVANVANLRADCQSARSSYNTWAGRLACGFSTLSFNRASWRLRRAD
jgi:hypothetical protein